MGHRNLYGVIAGGDGTIGQPIALGAQHDGKFRLSGNGGVIDADRAVAQAMAAVLKPSAWSWALPFSGQSAGQVPICAHGT